MSTKCSFLNSADETPCFTDSIQVFESTTKAEITNILGTTGKTCTPDLLPTKLFLALRVRRARLTLFLLSCSWHYG